MEKRQIPLDRVFMFSQQLISEEAAKVEKEQIRSEAYIKGYVDALNRLYEDLDGFKD